MFEAIEEFRKRLNAGEVLIGSGLSFTDAQVSDALAESIDFFWIDLEHSAMSPEAMRGHLLAARRRALQRRPAHPAEPRLARAAPGTGLQAVRPRQRPVGVP